MTIGRLAAILTPSHTTTRNYCTGLASSSSSYSAGVLATPLMHDVKLWTARQSGESRALMSVLRNHVEGYALLYFHYTCRCLI